MPTLSDDIVKATCYLHYNFCESVLSKQKKSRSISPCFRDYKGYNLQLTQSFCAIQGLPGDRGPKGEDGRPGRTGDRVSFRLS